MRDSRSGQSPQAAPIGVHRAASKDPHRVPDEGAPRSRALGPDTHYLLGRKQGGFPLRMGSRPAVEALLAELKAEWQEYRRASNPEFRIKGLRAIHRARAANDTARLAALKKRYPDAAEYDKRERRYSAKDLASSVVGSIRDAPTKSSTAVRHAVGTVTKGSKKAIESAVPTANGLLATTQGLLASALSTDVNALVQNMVKGPATIYDKAMDAGVSRELDRRRKP